MPSELLDLLRAVARHHHGLGFLHQGYLESVAITLGAHPFAVDAARAWLETPDGRAEMIDAVHRLRAQPAAAGAVPAAPAGGDPGAPGAEVDRLLQAAAQRAGGLASVARGPVVAVAEAFGVHPYVVLRARGVLERQGLARSPASDEGGAS